MVPGVELERHATGHEMSNQQSERQSLLYKHSEDWWLLATSQLHVFAAGSSPKVVILAQPPLL